LVPSRLEAGLLLSTELWIVGKRRYKKGLRAYGICIYACVVEMHIKDCDSESGQDAVQSMCIMAQWRPANQHIGLDLVVVYHARIYG